MMDETDSAVMGTDPEPQVAIESTRLNAPDSPSKKRRQSERQSVVLDANQIDFVPPDEGTPAAEALAANAAIKVTKIQKVTRKIGRTIKRPKMKNFNIVKQLNKKTKRKQKKNLFAKNFKGKVIDGLHELYTLNAGMVLGIRYCMRRSAASEVENMKNLTLADFSYVEKVIFPPQGSSPIPSEDVSFSNCCSSFGGAHDSTPSHSLAHTFKFKSYFPRIFERIRLFFGIDAASYMYSVCGDYNFIEFISNSKSGQFFFYSHDGKFMIKTQTKEENRFLKRILPHYYKFITENPHSMLIRILGMHRVKMYHLRRKVHFVIMTSVFDTPAQINTIYDLKGSMIGRQATQKERCTGGVLKDQDLVSDGRKLHFGSKKGALMGQLCRDARFLASLNIMDYSLLVGIHDRASRDQVFETLSPSTDELQKASALPPTHSNTPFRRSSQPLNIYNADATVDGAEREDSAQWIIVDADKEEEEEDAKLRARVEIERDSADGDSKVGVRGVEMVPIVQDIDASGSQGVSEGSEADQPSPALNIAGKDDGVGRGTRYAQDQPLEEEDSESSAMAHGNSEGLQQGKQCRGKRKKGEKVKGEKNKEQKEKKEKKEEKDTREKEKKEGNGERTNSTNDSSSNSNPSTPPRGENRAAPVSPFLVNHYVNGKASPTAKYRFIPQDESKSIAGLYHLVTRPMDMRDNEVEGEGEGEDEISQRRRRHTKRSRDRDRGKDKDKRRHKNQKEKEKIGGEEVEKEVDADVADVAVVNNTSANTATNTSDSSSSHYITSSDPPTHTNADRSTTVRFSSQEANDMPNGDNRDRSEKSKPSFYISKEGDLNSRDYEGEEEYEDYEEDDGDDDGEEDEDEDDDDVVDIDEGDSDEEEVDYQLCGLSSGSDGYSEQTEKQQPFERVLFLGDGSLGDNVDNTAVKRERVRVERCDDAPLEDRNMPLFSSPNCRPHPYPSSSSPHSNPHHSKNGHSRRRREDLSKQLVMEDGQGATGEEGYRLSRVFKSSELLNKPSSTDNLRQLDTQRSLPYSHFSPSHHVQYTSPLPSLLGKTSTHHQAASSRTLSSPSLSEDLAAAAGGEYTYGPGASNIRPWTRRVDQGINSRVDNKQGGEIYYIGIIDILQQYNNHKKAETFFKGVLGNDVKQISSVDPFKYADRFIAYIDANTD